MSAQQPLPGTQQQYTCKRCGCLHPHVRHGRITFVYHRDGIAKVVAWQSWQ